MKETIVNRVMETKVLECLVCSAVLFSTVGIDL